MADKCKWEGPVSDYNGGNGPGNATSMPTKSYPASSKLGEHAGKGTTVDSPAPKDGYTK